MDVGLENLTAEEFSAELDGKYLTFYSNDQLFGVPIAIVVQIVGIQHITPMPDYPSYVKGIIDLRGDIIPVIDMRLRLGALEKEYEERTCIIVAKIREHHVGLIVDAVDEVTDIDEESISQPPRLSEATTVDSFLTGVAKVSGRVALLLDTDKTLCEDIVININ